MESRSATTPPMKRGKYKGALSAGRTKKRLGVLPLAAVPARGLVKTLEKAPCRLVVQRVMREDAGRLAAISGEIVYQDAQRRLLADEAARAVPVDDVDMCIDFHDTGHSVATA